MLEGRRGRNTREQGEDYREHKFVIQGEKKKYRRHPWIQKISDDDDDDVGRTRKGEIFRREKEK